MKDFPRLTQLLKRYEREDGLQGRLGLLQFTEDELARFFAMRDELTSLEWVLRRAIIATVMCGGLNSSVSDFRFEELVFPTATNVDSFVVQHKEHDIAENYLLDLASSG